MTGRDPGPNGQRAASQCARRRFQDGQRGLCWRVPAQPLDAAVETHGLEALPPEHVALAVAVLHQREADARELHRPWPLPLERACDEAQRAARQCEAVEPENRLVARTLERRWHETLPPVEALAQAHAEARRRQRREVSPAERQHSLRLAADLPAVWQAPTTTQTDRKALWRWLVTQSALTPVEGSPRQPQGQGRWHTRATTDLWVPRPRPRDRRRTPLAVVDTIATLAAGRTDDASAAALNTHGLHRGRGQPGTAAAVAWMRDTDPLHTPGSAPRLAARLEARPDGRSATRALALQLGVTIATVPDWRAQGIMPASHETPGGPWWHTVTPAVLAILRQHLRRVPLHTDTCGIPNAH
jgi:hypothetical protein